MYNAQNRKDRTLFVSMMSKSITDDDLYEILSRAGPIEKIIFKENHDGTPLHALVVFKNVESVVYSMNHILPMARSSQLAELRPLRESSFHNPSSSSDTQPSSTPLMIKHGLRGGVTQPSYITGNNNSVSCCNNKTLPSYITDEKPTNYMSPESKSRTPQGTSMMRSYLGHVAPQNIAAPITSNSKIRYPVAEGSAHPCTPPSVIYYRPPIHVGNCSKICSANT
ncbi:RRM domain-containing protein [Trichostrongylus colubriformis]|uniref:RRM domain-containing protein n=1 Tax=Trichostrongylus colubriformis TaxID=6319 RepID=A0AAN8IK74_TRICO